MSAEIIKAVDIYMRKCENGMPKARKGVNQQDASRKVHSYCASKTQSMQVSLSFNSVSRVTECCCVYVVCVCVMLCSSYDSCVVTR